MPPSGPPSSVKRSFRLTRTVMALGLVSLLTDAASDMIWPLLPVFIVEHLRRPMAYVGLIESVAEGTAAILKYYSGRWSDRLARKKPLVLAGYSVSSFVRPLLSIAGSSTESERVCARLRATH
jgi:MFS family permease